MTERRNRRHLTHALLVSGLLALVLAVGASVAVQEPGSGEPDVRIGIERNVSTVTLESAAPFDLDGRSVRSARFTSMVALDAGREEYRREDFERRMVIELDDGTVLVRSMGGTLQAAPGTAPLAVNGTRYRGTMEVRSSDETFTVINELPLETYLLAVVPNELGPVVFPELEALKAQAVAARTYIVRNMGQFESQGYDICATQQCQVYFGMDTEHRWVALAEHVLDDARVSPGAELSLLFVDEATMADLNERHMGAQGPTDVLAFPIDEDPIEQGRWPDNGTTGPDRPIALPGDLPVLLGDVVVCPARAVAQAAEHAGTPNHTGSGVDEIALLVVHGILHVLGMDHAEPDETEAMQAREQDLLGRFHAS